ncbi:hypothetical protein M8C21_006894, partial [Ambrosia artemisiifolia]
SLDLDKMVRAPCFDKNGIKKGAWSEDEDNKLRSYIQRYGHPNWRELPKLAGLSRCGKSCRLRWMNYLRPNVKHGNFTKEEEDVIIGIHNKLGNKWSKMAALLPGRSDNEIKNHWHTHLRNRVQKDQTHVLKKEQSGRLEPCVVNPAQCLLEHYPNIKPQQEVEILLALYDKCVDMTTDVVFELMNQEVEELNGGGIYNLEKQTRKQNNLVTMITIMMMREIRLPRSSGPAKDNGLCDRGVDWNKGGKSTRKDDDGSTTTAAAEKPVRKTKRAKASKRETEPEFFDDQRELDLRFLLCLLYCVSGFAYALAIYLEAGAAQLLRDETSIANGIKLVHEPGRSCWCCNYIAQVVQQKKRMQACVALNTASFHLSSYESDLKKPCFVCGYWLLHPEPASRPKIDDVSYSPVVHAFAVATTKSAFFYVDERKLSSELKSYMEENKIIVKDYGAVSSDVALLASNQLTSANDTLSNGASEIEVNSHKIWADPHCCYSLYSMLNPDQVLLQPSPLALPKSLKLSLNHWAPKKRCKPEPCTTSSCRVSPVMLKKFESGVTVIQIKSHNEVDLLNIYTANVGLVQKPDALQTGVSATDAARTLGIAPAMAKEHLLATEQRCGKSCRLRWMNYLHPNVKHGNFTKEEDVIIGVHIKLGNKVLKSV